MEDCIDNINDQVLKKIRSGRLIVKVTDRFTYDYAKNGMVVELRSFNTGRIVYYTHEKALLERM